MSSAPTAPVGVFVYGTLRPGEANAGLWDRSPLVSHRPATAPGLAVGEPCRGHFPYAWPRPGGVVHGELLSVSGDGRWLLGRLDRLEGYRPAAPRHSLYIRQVLPVILPGAVQVAAWGYLAGPGTDVTVLHRLADGDWRG